MTDFITQIDFNILNAIQSIRNPFLDTIMPLITFLGSGGIVWAATALIMLCFKKSRKTGIIIIVSLLLGLFLSTMGLKNVIARERPYNTEGADDRVHIRQLIENFQTDCALTGDNLLIVEGVDEGHAGFLLQLAGVVVGVVIRAFDEADLRAEGFGGFDLADRRAVGKIFVSVRSRNIFIFRRNGYFAVQQKIRYTGNYSCGFDMLYKAVSVCTFSVRCYLRCVVRNIARVLVKLLSQ